MPIPSYEEEIPDDIVIEDGDTDTDTDTDTDYGDESEEVEITASNAAEYGVTINALTPILTLVSEGNNVYHYELSVTYTVSVSADSPLNGGLFGRSDLSMEASQYVPEIGEWVTGPHSLYKYTSPSSANPCAKPIRRGWIKAPVGYELVNNQLMPVYANKRIIKGWIGDENNHPQLILRSVFKNWTSSMDLKPEGLTFTPERKNICGYNNTLYGIETSLGKIWKRVNDEFITVTTHSRLESTKCLSIVHGDKLYFIAANYGYFDILEYSEPEGVPTIEFKAQYSEEYPNNFELFDVHIFDNKLYILVQDFRISNNDVVFLIWDPATLDPGPYTIHKGPQFKIPNNPSPNFNYGVMYRGNIHFISPYSVNYPNYDFAHHVMDIKKGTIQVIPKEYSPYATGWGDPTLFVVNDEIHALTDGTGHSYWDGINWHTDDPSPIQGRAGVSCVMKNEVHLFEPGTKSHYISTDNIFN